MADNQVKPGCRTRRHVLPIDVNASANFTWFALSSPQLCGSKKVEPGPGEHLARLQYNCSVFRYTELKEDTLFVKVSSWRHGSSPKTSQARDVQSAL